MVSTSLRGACAFPDQTSHQALILTQRGVPATARAVTASTESVPQFSLDNPAVQQAAEQVHAQRSFWNTNNTLQRLHQQCRFLK
jgi:hypothetical protein